jgi:hypothetical protein
LVYLTLFQNCSSLSIHFQVWKLLNEHVFLWGGVITPHAQNPTWRTRGSLLFGSSPLTCLPLKKLTVATLPLAWLSGSFDHATPTIASE